MDIQSINNPQELLESSESQNTYDFENFIKVDTMGGRRRSKRKLQLLKVLDSEIQNIIDEDETVFFVTDGVLVNGFEQLFIGWVAYYYNLTAFVFTTKRVLLIHIMNRKTRGVFLRSIEYADMREVKGGMLSGFKIKMRSSKALTFSRVPGADRKELGAFLNQVLDRGAAKDPGAIGMRNLCPNCLTDYGEAIVKECAHCSMEFKIPKKAAMLSLLMPGLGDLYLGSKVLGGLELVFMGFIWLSVLTAMLAEISTGVPVLAAMLTFAVVWLIIHPIDAVKSYHMGSKGLFPVQAPASYGTVTPGDIATPVVPLKANRLTGKLLLVFPVVAFILVFGFLTVIGIMSEAGMIPTGEIVSGKNIPQQAMHQLVENDLVTESSEILYFYSDGLFSFLEGGTILTKDSLTIYYLDENSVVTGYRMNLNEIKEVVKVSEGSEMADSIYRVNGFLEDQWLQFNLPVEGSADVQFITELESRVGNALSE